MALTDNKAKIQQLLDGINALPEAGSGEPTLQEKTVSPTTSSQSVTPDSGYDGLSKVTVNAMPTATQATPSISVSSAGKITASATQTAGYVAAGTKSATKQLTVQAAQTITPGTSNKTIASGRYLTGTQTIKGDANLIAGNIKQGVSIFGVAGSLQAGEDVTAETTAYTNLLANLDEAVNALPDAGGGGSSLPVCAVTINVSNGENIAPFIDFLSIEDGAISAGEILFAPTGTYNITTLQGGIINISTDGFDGFSSNVTCSNCRVVRQVEEPSEGTIRTIIIALNANATTASFTVG